MSAVGGAGARDAGAERVAAPGPARAVHQPQHPAAVGRERQVSAVPSCLLTQWIECVYLFLCVSVLSLYLVLVQGQSSGPFEISALRVSKPSIARGKTVLFRQAF